MAEITFYEKPGCVNNTRQKQLLIAAGHQLTVKNLLSEPWQAEQLQAFFVGLAVRDWFNYSAPAIKYGELDTESLSATEALALMLDNPLLIRRPLMQSGTRRMAGFDINAVTQWLGVDAAPEAPDWEHCPKQTAQPLPS
ncbi:MAG: nitrogenase-associated protein [Methylococcaceae bacterium]|nr:nitrogenase-associated protein [Methylococcaceae bacterium]